jgi:polysaccharide pyruvyl transferase WcaK-like protein
MITDRAPSTSHAVNPLSVLMGFSWSFHNIGSIAIAPGLAALVRRSLPDAQIRVLASQPEGHPELLDVRDYYCRHFPDLTLLPNSFEDRKGGQSHSSAWRALVEEFGDDVDALDAGTLSPKREDALLRYVLGDYAAGVVQELEREQSPVLRAFREASLYCYTSGTMLNYGRAGKRDFWGYTLNWAFPLVIARHLGVPYGVYANSFEELAPPSDRFYRTLLGDAQFVSFRDGESLQYVRSLGIDPPKAAYRPDSAFFFPFRNEEFASAFLERHGLVDRRFATATIRTGGQFGPLSGVMPADRERRHMATMRDFVEGWTRETGLPILLCPEVDQEIEPMRRLVYDGLSPTARERTIWMDHFWTPDEALAVYGRARLVCSMEVHSIVLGLGAGTPVLHPQFWESGRKAWMLRDLGLEEWLLDIDTVDGRTITERALAIHRDYPASLARVGDARARIDRLGTEAATQMRASARQPAAVAAAGS